MRPRLDSSSLPAVAAVGAVLTALCIVTIDQPVARWIATRDAWPDVWNQAIAVLEYPLGIEPWKWTGVVVLCTGVAASLAVPRWRRHAPAWMLVALVHLASRNASLWIKTLTGRLRPSEWLARGGDTFFRDGGISFPSGHVLLFASLAMPIAWLYPRWRPLLVIPVFAVIARVAVDAHFVSDVLGGLALTAAITWGCGLAVRPLLAPAAPRSP